MRRPPVHLVLPVDEEADARRPVEAVVRVAEPGDDRVAAEHAEVLAGLVVVPAHRLGQLPGRGAAALLESDDVRTGGPDRGEPLGPVVLDRRAAEPQAGTWVMSRPSTSTAPESVLAGRRSQSFAELRSFARWAQAMGREATGRVLAQEYRPATPEDAARLHLAEGVPLLKVLRVRGLDGEPVLVERTVYADWISPAVETVEPDCASVTQRLYGETGLVFAHGEHVIDAVAAGARDAAPLAVRRTSPLLRVRRVTTTHDGRPLEWSDDRYRPDAVSFTVHNAIGHSPLVRTTAG
ncbi:MULTISPECIES: GntR family transcriptional regulator [Streptomyces]|uniref:GntR family transcriptional regulator n=2 Tax=Streptomyces TaxID=1883 RepID=A0ABU4KEZ3_9ACTN|nr:GntR family transcriptional regulator [Streptomyces roseolus]MDX2296354.1 GntR family transcriptional regulator [Streptomyces roseolus]